MTCAPGMVLEDTYRILAVLGKGGSGTVYLARHMRGGRLWAVKEIQGTKSRLIMEAELLKRLRHPGLPAVGDVLEAEGMLYLVMDYIEGKSLKQILDEEGPQSEARAADWGAAAVPRARLSSRTQSACHLPGSEAVQYHGAAGWKDCAGGFRNGERTEKRGRRGIPCAWAPEAMRRRNSTEGTGRPVRRPIFTVWVRCFTMS